MEVQLPAGRNTCIIFISINQSIIYLNQAEAHNRLDRQGSMKKNN